MLLLIIAPTTSSKVVGPFSGVRGSVDVEFVIPNKVGFIWFGEIFYKS